MIEYPAKQNESEMRTLMKNLVKLIHYSFIKKTI